MGTPVTWEQVIAWRMSRQGLLRQGHGLDVTGMAARLCGLHAQLTTSPEVALLARMDGLDRDAVRDALWTRRELVRLWAVRGTLHLLPAAELGLWIGALGSYRHYRVTDPATARLVAAVGDALADGAMLTRAELAAEVERRTGSAELARLAASSWGTLLKPVSFAGKLCFGPGKGGRAYFTHPAVWVPGGVTAVSQETALAAITRRYLGAFGPATEADLARWWGAGTVQARRLLRSLGDEVAQVKVDGERRSLLTCDLPALSSAAGPPDAVRLLPAFDQWVICQASTEPALLDPRYRDRVFRRQGWISAVMLTAGRISGVWAATRAGRRLRVELTAFWRPPSWAREAAESEVARVAGFYGCEPDVSWRR
jgi:hypothetical protein